MYNTTKLIALSNKNTKSDSFYLRFRDQLLQSQAWPGIYLFKFIVRYNSNESKQLKEYLNGYEGEITENTSKNKKFLTLTFSYYADSPSEVIEIYRGVEFIDKIISL